MKSPLTTFLLLLAALTLAACDKTPRAAERQIEIKPYTKEIPLVTGSKMEMMFDAPAPRKPTLKTRL